MAKEEEETIIKTTKKLLKLLKVEADLTIEQDKEGVFHLGIETEEDGLLIGRHGEALNSLQLILGLMIYNKLKKWQKIILDVGDYRKKRRQALEKLALQAAEEVVLTKKPRPLPPFSSFERRIIHLVLSNHPKVISESEGEGENRRVVIKPKTNSSK